MISYYCTIAANHDAKNRNIRRIKRTNVAIKWRAGAREWMVARNNTWPYYVTLVLSVRTWEMGDTTHQPT